MKKIILILFLVISLTACSNNIDDRITYEYNYNTQLTTEDITNIEKDSNNNIIIELFLDAENKNDWKEDIDFDSMTSEEIDQYIKEQRELSKGYYTLLNNNFKNDFLTNSKAKISCSTYSPIIEIEYSNYNELNEEIDLINTILLNSKVSSITIYV